MSVSIRDNVTITVEASATADYYPPEPASFIVDVNKKTPTLSVTNSNVNLTYGTNGNNGYTYNGDGAGTREHNGNPSLNCSDSVDRYTVSSTNGNGMLNYPVGMITADEIVMAGAGGSTTTANNTYYLYTGGEYWSMSPSFYDSTNKEAHVFLLDQTYMANNYTVGYSYGIRPMVSLKSGTIVSGGSGLKTDPYRIS